MKKIICILLCMLVLIGCSAKSVEIPSNSENNVNQNEEINNNKEDLSQEKNKKYDTYSLYSGAKSEKGRWYYDVPYLNEIFLGNARTFANGDNWWLAFAMDIMAETSDLDEAFDLSIEAYYSGVKNLFVPPEEGFNPTTKELVKVLDFDMYKFEGYIENTNHKEGPSSNCWIYGYSFIIGNTPCAMLGMTFEDDSDQAKKDIVMYVDDMVQSLRVE